MYAFNKYNNLYVNYAVKHIMEFFVLYTIINFENYDRYFITYEIIILFLSISNYFFIYRIKLILVFMSKTKV